MTKPKPNPGQVRERADVREQSWWRFAACRGEDPDIFFPVGKGEAWEAIHICASCPARKACLEFAIANYEDVGIWGGFGARGRKRIRRLREAQTIRNGAA